MDKLTPIDSQLYAARVGDDGRVVCAEFFLYVREAISQKPRLFSLMAMTIKEYEAWFMDRHARGGLHENQGDGFPLVVPDVMLATRGLVEFVQDIYLCPGEPHNIARLLPFLTGPFREDD